MSAKKPDSSRPQEIRNPKAGRDYLIEEKFEAGVMLKGTEVKSIRAGKAQIQDSFVRFEKGEPWLFNAHIQEYSFGNLNNHNPTRSRKLLLNRREILKIRQEMEARGRTCVPLRIYFKHGLIKVEVALAVGKKLHDKREDLKKKVALREAERVVRQWK